MHSIESMPVRIVAAIFIFISVSLFSCIAYEWYNYSEETKDLQVYVNLAAKQSLKQQQDLYLQWNSTGSLAAALATAERYSMVSPEAAAEILDGINAGTINANHVAVYADRIETLANTTNLRDYEPWRVAAPNPADRYSPADLANITDLFANLRYLRDRATVDNGNYNPLQFGMTYVDENVLAILFRDNLNKMIQANFEGENASSDFLAFSMRQWDGTGGGRVVVSQPRLIRLSDTLNPESERVYAQLFGTFHGMAADMYDDLSYDSSYGGSLAYDAFYDYVVAYEVTFWGGAWHNLKTPLGRMMAGTNLIWGGAVDTANQPISTYRLFHASGGFTEYLSMSLPRQSYSTNYILVN